MPRFECPAPLLSARSEALAGQRGHHQLRAVLRWLQPTKDRSWRPTARSASSTLGVTSSVPMVSQVKFQKASEEGCAWLEEAWPYVSQSERGGHTS